LQEYSYRFLYEDKAKRIRGVSNSAHCFFNNDENSNYSNVDDFGGSSSNFIDFGQFIDQVIDL